MIVHLACVLAMLASCQSSTNDKALEMSPDQYAAFDEVSGFSMRQPPSAMLAADRLNEEPRNVHSASRSLSELPPSG